MIRTKCNTVNKSIYFMRSLIMGFGSLLAIGGSYYNSRLYDIVATSDADALRSDWKTVGMDFRKAIETIQTELVK